MSASALPPPPRSSARETWSASALWQPLNALGLSSLVGTSSGRLAYPGAKNGNARVVRRGYMLKKGEKDPFKAWKRRWFVLYERPRKIFYFKTKELQENSDKADANVLGTIDLSHVKADQVYSLSPKEERKNAEGSASSPPAASSASTTSSSPRVNGEKQFMWRIDLGEGGRVYELACPTEEDRSGWITCVQLCCGSNNSTAPVLTEEVIQVLSSPDMDDYEYQRDCVQQLTPLLRPSESNHLYKDTIMQLFLQIGGDKNTDVAIRRELAVAFALMDYSLLSEYYRETQDLLLSWLSSTAAPTELIVTILDCFIHWFIAFDENIKKKMMDSRLKPTGGSGGGGGTPKPTFHNKYCAIAVELSIRTDVNSAVQRKALQLLALFVDAAASEGSLDTLGFTKQTLKDLLSPLNCKAAIANKKEEGVTIGVLTILCVLCKSESAQPLFDHKSIVRPIISLFNVNYEHEVIKTLMEYIAVNLCKNERIRTKMQKIGTGSFIHAVNSALPAGAPHYYYSNHYCRWLTPEEKMAVFSPSSNLPLPTKRTDKGKEKQKEKDKAKQREKERKEPKHKAQVSIGEEQFNILDFKDVIIHTLNSMLRVQLKEEGAPISISILDLTLPPPPDPTTSSNSIFSVNPYFVSNNKAKVELNIKPNMALKVKATTKKKIMAMDITLSDLEFVGTLILGFTGKTGLRPTWLSFETMPTVRFACGLTGLGIQVQKLLSVIIEKTIRKKFLYPNRFFPKAPVPDPVSGGTGY